ncbi:uncharacterized protein LOC110766219 [Prunus avium]|uniref:Uncharacterized protein LOC110766219 n=1 Tax=Prunus avium TaxID=42229 RepID=A0A6P5TDQ8_PRUAV|nr:uncharacterized protein LOC110766219 [Prunus avium]
MQGKRWAVCYTHILRHRSITCKKTAGELCRCICTTGRTFQGKYRQGGQVESCFDEAADLSGFDNSNRTFQGNPDFLVCLTTLQELDLSGTMIESIPATIKQSSELSILHLSNCKSLHSLPELPVLTCVEAHGCTSLKTVASTSRTALTQGWGEYLPLIRLDEKFLFSNCQNLDQNACSNIMADVHLRIMPMATAISKLREEREYERFGSVYIVCPGNEIPNWFIYQNEGSSIKIKLPSNSLGTDFLGCAVSVVAFDNYTSKHLGGATWCLALNCRPKYKVDDVVLALNAMVMPLLSMGNRVTDTSFDFYQMDQYLPVDLYKDPFFPADFQMDMNDLPYRPVYHLQVKTKKCGISLLYAQDAEKLKSHVVSCRQNRE